MPSLLASSACAWRPSASYVQRSLLCRQLKLGSYAGLVRAKGESERWRGESSAKSKPDSVRLRFGYKVRLSDRVKIRIKVEAF